MRKLIVRSGGRLVQTIELKPGPNRLGRDPMNDLCVDDPTVSGHHCEILVSGADVLVRDLGSTNGTFVDGQRIEEASLSPGQSLRLGLVEMGLDTPPIHVAVSASSVPKLPEPTVLPDGTPCCLNHPGVPATCACLRCRQLFCADCVRELRRVGGKAMVFCPACDGPCELLTPTSMTRALATGKRRSWFGSVTRRLKETFGAIASSPRRRRSR